MSKLPESEIVTHSAEAAEEAGLRYVSDDQPGYRRELKDQDFDYSDTEGRPILDEQRLLIALSTVGAFETKNQAKANN